MIQRIQTIWLFLASVALFGLFFLPTLQLSNTDGVARSIRLTGAYDTAGAQVVQAQSFILLTVVGVIVALIPLVLIFFYKNRKQQMAFCYLTIVAILAFSFWLAQTAKNVAGNVEPGIQNFGIGAVLPSLAVIFMILAAKGIRNDQKLVRSADRLRG
ncbi:DUF4293 domain-containing protein [Hufsiella ginkgonis]|uniref:DUF4293 family protein n=1 Tax=Hufsiella ginkgonis TaxID=2695274 RepID=A0A7K1XRV9_9SPHI|nr:DUF4293 domain-containing protein [Hufsiella ginkgonis]MXV13723.1 DUF4293 family protein [Hufsiella ginkgonis]